jgi:hypothetical protein
VSNLSIPQPNVKDNPTKKRGSSKGSVGKTRMSFSLFNQDTGLKEGPSPYPLPQERKKEADLPGKGGARPESKGEKDFLSWGRG